MLSSLPTELIRQIIESTVPHTFHSTTYQNRQNTLCSLSLVSKLFHSIAQSTLFEIVWIKSAQDLIRVPCSRSGGGGGDSAGHLPCLIAEIVDDEDLPYLRANREAVEDPLRKFSSVRSLTLSNFPAQLINSSSLSFFQSTLLSLSRARPDLTLFLICRTTDLSILQITGEAFALTPSSPLISLKSLTLVDVTNDQWIRLLDPITLPNLRKLGLFYSSPLGVLSQAAFVNLLPQLDSLQLDVGRWKDSSSDFLRPHAASVLIDCLLFGLEHVLQPRLNFIHIRLNHLYSGCSDVSFLGFDDFLMSLSKTPSLPLRSVYLDSSLQSIDSLPSAPRRRIQRLHTVCQERGIDIVFEPVSREYGIDSYLSEEFCGRQQASKRDGGDATRGV
jgi:hypothetical protein